MKIKKVLIFLFLLCPWIMGYSSVNDSLKISLITCSPGSQVYELFGHSGLRVQDMSHDIDVVFHYGVFSFETPNFIYRFTKGETDYSIGLSDYRDFVYSYVMRDSEVSELPLKLTQEECNRIYKALVINNMPGNRIYRYNFLYDNCATRPRNIIIENLSGKIRYNESADTITFRKMIHECTQNYPWLTLGIDLALGAPLDKPISYEEQMFLPSVLMDAFKNAEVQRGDSLRPFAEDPILLIESDAMSEVFDEDQWVNITPLFVFSLLLVLVIIVSVIEIIKCRHYRVIDTIVFSIYGLTGCVLFFLMFISIHPATYPNYSGFWTNPFLLIFPVIIWVKSMKKVVYYCHFINFAVLLCLLVSWYWLPQQMNVAFLPLVLISAIRSVTYIWVDHRKKEIRR